MDRRELRPIRNTGQFPGGGRKTGTTGPFWGVAVIFLVFLLTPEVISAAEPLRGELWIRADLVDIAAPGSRTGTSGELSERERLAIDALLEDARWVFSGMIYGFSFHWVPPSRSRSVPEILSIAPLALITRGDPRMTAVSVIRESGFIYVQLEYLPDSSQEGRLNGWQSPAFPASTGTAAVSVNGGTVREALETAVRDAVHQWLRVRDYNRPREISGRVALTDFPLVGMTGGQLNASVRISLDLEKVRPYSVD